MSRKVVRAAAARFAGREWRRGAAGGSFPTLAEEGNCDQRSALFEQQAGGMYT